MSTPTIPPMSTLQAALFDLDGTMADSDPLHYLVFDELLRTTGVLLNGLTHEFFKKNIAGGRTATYSLVCTRKSRWRSTRSHG